MEFNPYPYQKQAINHILDNPYSGLFLDMGLGKTVTTLTAINDLLYDYFDISKVLIIAPLRVAKYTWSDELVKWEHISHLKIVKVLGTAKQREKALREKSQIYITNRENITWLVNYYGSDFPFDMVVIDELSSFKDSKTSRFKALRKVRAKVKRVVGLTGTPAPNGLMNLWTQLYLLDRGERLEQTLTRYRNKYFKPGRRNGHIIYDYVLLPEADNKIYDKIGDICISMKSEDYIDLPERINNYIKIEMPDGIRKQYKEFEKHQILSIVDDVEFSSVNATALSNKLAQFSNGAVYYDGEQHKGYHEAHKLKLDALSDIVNDSNGKSILVFYNYIHDKERILGYFKNHNIETLGDESIAKWNNSEIEILLAHPASCGHGLNLQYGGNIIVWFGLTWSLELYQQACARLYRQGQKESVVIHHLILKDTIDEDIIKAIECKGVGQELLLNAVKAIIDKYK